MSKNLVVCMDGTNNQFGLENTNVVRLYDALVDDSERQRRYYDPGVGTMGHPAFISRAGQKLTALLGLAFGLGVTQNILDAYAFLMRHHAEGDRIFIFGFSRGALEARALAALLYRCGLLRPELETLGPYAVTVAQSASNIPEKMRQHEEVAAAFTKTFSKSVGVHFLGLWDTVTSMGHIWSPITWPYTTSNPSVTHVRHAIALDERRTFFRQNRWDPGHRRPLGQDVKEMWFSGVHCDVGGGYPPNESALWTRPHEWMVKEAASCGLLIDMPKIDAPVAEARALRDDPTGTRSLLHDSMQGLKPLWLIAEWVPKPRRVENADHSYSTKVMWPVWHWFLPWAGNKGKMGRARTLKAGECLHRSVLERFAADDGYRPEPLLAIGMTVETARTFVATDAESYMVP